MGAGDRLVRRWLLTSWVLLLGVALPAVAGAQTGSTTLTLTPSLLTFASPTAADYAKGYVCAGSISASLAHGTGGIPNDALLIRLTQATDIQSNTGGVTKPLADFQYSTNSDATCATGTWQSVPASTATPATVHAAAHAPYTQIIYFRLKLSWTTDRGGVTYSLPGVNVMINNP